MNEQEAFNRVWQHFVVEQAPRSYLPGIGCAYHGEGGTRCALGVLIPDDQYQRAFEGRRAIAVAEQVPALNGVNRAFLIQLQACHDNARKSLFTYTIKTQLILLAREYHLEVPSEH